VPKVDLDPPLRIQDPGLVSPEMVLGIMVQFQQQGRERAIARYLAEVFLESYPSYLSFEAKFHVYS
jgi:hypothetical protein